MQLKRILFGSATVLTVVSFLLAMCQKSSTEEEPPVTSAVSSSNTAAAADRSDEGGCLACENLEWRIQCPQTCEGGFFNLMSIKFKTKSWNDATDCCVPDGQNWFRTGVPDENGVVVSSGSPLNQWIDLTVSPLKSGVYDVCDPGFTATFVIEARVNKGGIFNARLPGHVYIQTRRKGDVNNTTLRTHYILVNKDLTSCTPDFTPSSGDEFLTIVPVTITNGCAINSEFLVPGGDEFLECEMIPSGGGGTGTGGG